MAPTAVQTSCHGTPTKKLMAFPIAKNATLAITNDAAVTTRLVAGNALSRPKATPKAAIAATIGTVAARISGQCVSTVAILNAAPIGIRDNEAIRSADADAGLTFTPDIILSTPAKAIIQPAIGSVAANISGQSC